MKTYFIIVGTICVCYGMINQSILEMFLGVVTLTITLILLGE